eukprot:10938608-Heterocapsa_arctica.AAC.1
MIDKLIRMQEKEKREERYPEEREATEHNLEGAMKTDMSIEEEKIVLEWINSSQQRKDDAKFEDMSYLDIKDKLMGSMESVQKIMFNALVAGDKASCDMHSNAKLGWTPWKTLLEWLKQRDIWGPVSEK